MAPSRPPGVLAPGPLFVGALVAFLACTAAGRVLSRADCYKDFRRFHAFLGDESLHLPTASHVRALARSRLGPDKVNVIVGGNSVLYGSGCGAEDIWTPRLQELLGDGYRVLNLALPGGKPHEFGGTAAEFLSRDFPRVIFITNYFSVPDEPVAEPDGRPCRRYFFWEARRKGWLLPDPHRARRLRELKEGRRGREDPSFAELRSQVALDDLLYFRDFWTAAEYRHFSTTWCPLVRAAWWLPRKAYADPEATTPPRPPPAQGLALLRGMISGQDAFLRANGPPPAGPGAPSRWLAWSLRDCFPAACRRRTLMLVSHWNSYLVSQLSPEEKVRYFELTAQTLRGMEQLGMTARDVGKDYPPDHFVDCVHLSKTGHRRMAEEVAPLVRGLARRLGYTGAAGGPDASSAARPAGPPGRERGAGAGGDGAQDHPPR